VASAESNLRSLPTLLPADAAIIQRAKRAEFHSLGLVLGYSYASSPVIQPSTRPPGEPDSTCYTPTTEPGARLPHAWMPDGSSLYDRLGPGFTLLGPEPPAQRLAEHARKRGIPFELREPPAGYPWADEFLLVRPDQHIAWRGGDPGEIDLDLVTGFSAGCAPRRR
jgi:hypothetical protein